MTDKEKREDEALKNCIEEAYGCTDDELLAELEEIEKNLSDSDFPGIEDRVYRKLMARIAEEEEEKAAEASILKDIEKSVEVAAEPEPETGPKTDPEPNPILNLNSAETEGNVARVGKKKILMVAVLAAAFVGALGVTAIGGKSYFFRQPEVKNMNKFDNTKSKIDVSNIETAYNEIANEFDIKVLKLNYMPREMEFDNVVFKEDGAVISLNYKGNIIYFTQIIGVQESNLGFGSDRKSAGVIENKWLDKKIQYSKNNLEDGNTELEAKCIIDNVAYCLFGKIEEEEFIKMVEFINFY